MQVELPLDDDEASSPGWHGDAPRRLQGMRLLLVEDNANNRQVATELLT